MPGSKSTPSGPRRAARAGRSRSVTGWLALAALGPAAALAQGGQPGDAARAYRVECMEGAVTCAADVVTYIGWRVFDRYCTSCHAADAEGSAFAPSLVRRVRQLDRREFDAALDRGYSGRFAPMRPWGEHPQVARYYDELWSYLKARANGDLRPVPLEPLRE